jgi:hypothetical protein
MIDCLTVGSSANTREKSEGGEGGREREERERVKQLSGETECKPTMSGVLVEVGGEVGTTTKSRKIQHIAPSLSLLPPVSPSSLGCTAAGSR